MRNTIILLKNQIEKFVTPLAILRIVGPPLALSECQCLKQANLSIKYTHPYLCIVNDTEELKEINHLSEYTCKIERDRILDA